MKTAVIFDFDGVIVDSEPVRYETYRQLFRNNYSIILPEKMDNKLIGRTQKKNMKYFLDTYNLKGDIEELIQQRAALLKEAFSKKENIKPIPGIFNLLKNLKSHRIKLAIASSSSKEYINNILNHLGLTNVFEVIVTGDIINKSKPDPEIFLLTAKKLNKKKQDCVVIEDTVNGINAAKAACMKVIAITSYFSREKLSSADIVIDKFSQINFWDIQNIYSELN